MIETLLSNWTFMRTLRLAIGAYFLITGIQEHEYLFSMIGGFFVIQAALNMGCEGGNCAAPTRQPRKFGTPNDVDNATYEEIK